MSDRFDHEVRIPLSHEEHPVPDEQDQSRAAHAAASDPTAPINIEEPMAERIARIKRQQAEGESGESASPTSGLSESSNTSTTAASADRDASDPQRSASTSATRSDASVAAGASLQRGAAPSGQPAPGTDTATASEKLAAGETARVSDGSKTGERVRATSTSIVPESNDVMLGDQSSRKDGDKDTTNALPTTDANKLQTDGSRSPHDRSSDGSRQETAHQQLRDAQNAVEQDETPPAFRAEAKARTI